jgi:hypothetical protein
VTNCQHTVYNQKDRTWNTGKELNEGTREDRKTPFHTVSRQIMKHTQLEPGNPLFSVISSVVHMMIVSH